MLTYDEAIAMLLDAIAVLPNETVRIEDAAGRYLAEPVRAAIDAPRAHVSAMDGYAVQLADTAHGQPLTVVGEAAAGAPFDRKIARGEAVRIFTGAYIPAGADCVIMQEYASRDGDRVSFAEGFGPACHIRFQAGDFARGDTLLERGQRLTPGAMVALAGADMAEVEVVRQPKVAIIATGDELADPGSAHLSNHSVPESGSYGVAALARNCGAMLVQRARGRDDLDVLTAIAHEALRMADCVVVIGGASVGDHDLARAVFGAANVEEKFARLAIKPGKPVWFGNADGTPVLGLPGNPTSALVTARLFLMPLLAKIQGGDGAEATRFGPQVLCGTLPANGSRETFVRARLTAHGLVPSQNQESGAQAPLATSDWLIRRPIGAPAIGDREIVPAIPF